MRKAHKLVPRRRVSGARIAHVKQLELAACTEHPGLGGDVPADDTPEGRHLGVQVLQGQRGARSVEAGRVRRKVLARLRVEDVP